MANTTITPNMNLIIPTVGQDSGPDYANNINASLTLIDQHDHSPGKGAPISSAGININTDLDFQGNSAINVENVTFLSQSVATSSLMSLSVAPGAESPTQRQDLWYTDNTGALVQITKNGQVFAPFATVQGIDYASGVFTFNQAQSSLPTTIANLASGPHKIFLSSASTSSTSNVTLAPPGAIASAYTLLLPNNPGLLSGDSFLTINKSTHQIEGTVALAGGIVNSMIATNTIEGNKIVQGAQITQIVASTLSPTRLDNIVLVDSSGGPVTVNLYDISTGPGYSITIKKTSSDINLVTINAFSFQDIKIYGSAGGPSFTSTTIVTQGEFITLTNDSVSSWILIQRDYPRNWIDFGTTVITATSGGVSKGTTAVDKMYYRREGNTMICRMEYKQTSAGSAGSGTYQIQLPGGWSADSSLIAPDTSISGGVAVTNAVGTMWIVSQSGGNSMTGNVIVHDTRNVTVQGNLLSASTQFWSSAQLSLGATTLSANGTFQIPISTWNE